MAYILQWTCFEKLAASSREVCLCVCMCVCGGVGVEGVGGQGDSAAILAGRTEAFYQSLLS